jgi:hypothetical protein
MTDTETITEVASVGAVAALIAVVLFAFGRQPIQPGFRIIPATLHEWLAFWFHTLEFALCSSILVASQSAFLYSPAHDTFVYIVLSLPPVIVISAIAFWRRARPLCIAALWWSLAGVIGFFLIPPIPITRAA